MNFLHQVMDWPGAPLRAELITGRAEEVAREPEMEATFDLVTARSFGPPSVTAECAARFLRMGGALIVSEPPDDSETGRWNIEVLEMLGLEARGRVRHGAAFQVLVKTRATPKEFPRAIGIPGKIRYSNVSRETLERVAETSTMAFIGNHVVTFRQD